MKFEARRRRQTVAGMSEYVPAAPACVTTAGNSGMRLLWHSLQSLRGAPTTGPWQMTALELKRGIRAACAAGFGTSPPVQPPDLVIRASSSSPANRLN